MIQRVLVLLVLLIFVAFPLPASAQEGPGAPDIVVQGTKTGTPLDQLTNAATIIDEAAIQAMRVPTVLEVLRQVEGLDVVRSGGPGGQTSLFLRGGNSNHVLVVIDGVKVNSPTTGAFDLANLTVDQIERIEVLRGAQSPLYGSEATAGVVNIITKRAATENHDTATIEGGAYHTWRGELTHSLRGPVWDQALSVSRWISRGISSADANLGNTEPDGYANTTFSAKVGRAAGVGGRADLTLRLTDAAADIDDYPPPTYQFGDFPTKLRNRAAVAGLIIATPLSARWDHRLTIGWSRDHGTTVNGASGDTDIDAQSRQVEWQHTLGIGADNLLSVGYEYQTRFANVPGAGEHRLVTNAVYVQDHFAALDPLFITIGGRTDDNNRFGRHNTYKAGAALTIAPWRSRVFGNYATGFRGPSLNDLYYPGYSNPTLRPEESTGYEAGIHLDPVPGRLAVQATRFRTRYRDLIALDSAYVPQNIASSDVVGAEFSGTWTAAAMATITGTYTVTNAVNGSTGARLARRPHNKGALIWTAHPDEASDLRAQYRVVGSRTDGGVNLPHYAVVDLSASNRLSSRTNIFIRIDNALNRDYQEVAGYGTPGRSFYAGVTTEF
ncbi:MAG: TonB-dependent receptor plug domain-containing protein [Nitrospirota bacterium]